MKRLLLLLISSVIVATPAWAQEPIATSFGELQGKIRLGETLFITDNRGTTIKGKLSGLDAASLLVRLGRNEAAPPLRLSESNVNNCISVPILRWSRLRASSCNFSHSSSSVLFWNAVP